MNCRGSRELGFHVGMSKEHSRGLNVANPDPVDLEGYTQIRKDGTSK
jgi:hypothetical protein